MAPPERPSSGLEFAPPCHWCGRNSVWHHLRRSGDQQWAWRGDAAAMSAFVFAGSSQFIAAGLVAGGAGLAIIIVTTFVVNLRHSLYSVSLAPYMHQLPQRWLLILGFTLTDETFLVVSQRYMAPDHSPNKHWFHLGSALIMYANWQVCTWIGIVAGSAMANPSSWGLDFALVVTFIGMLMPGLRSRPAVVCVIAAGVSALLFAGLPNRLGLLAATLVGVVAGILADTIKKHGKERQGQHA